MGFYRENPEADSIKGPRGQGLVPASMNISVPAPLLPDANDIDLLFEAINMILERRNDDGSVGTFFKKRSPKNKINMQLHVTSVCLRGMSLISRFPVIHDAYFEAETNEDMATIYPHAIVQWYAEPDAIKAREMLVEVVSDHILRRITWIVEKSNAPHAARVR